MMYRNRKVLILGASSDIGIEVVKTFLENKWQVFAHYCSNKKNLSNINNKKLELIKYKFDTIKNNTDELIRNKFLYDFDSFINLVGYIDNKDFNKFNSKSMMKSLSINTIIPFIIYKLLIKKMLSKKFGRILNCSSIGVKFGGGIKTFDYSLSKHCLEFIPGIYKDWAKFNVYINNLRIGVTDTKIHKKIKNKNLSKRIKMIPIGRMAKPHEIALSIYNLASEKNTLITGETITVAGGE